jgi:hypothetical protein
MKLKMNFKSSAMVFLAAGSLLATARVARADRRAYGVTYEAVLAPKGELDVESWSTYSEAGEIDGGPASRGARQMIELEYGITDRWDAALYNMLDVTSGDTDSGYAGFKIETRYRPSMPGEWFVDPIFYFEFADLFRGDANQTYELKLILAKDLGPLNVAVNGALEEERTSGATWNAEFEWAAGTSYALSPVWKLGVEAFGKTEEGDMSGLESRLWAGPAVSWAAGHGAGPMHGIWVTIAGGAGLTSESDKYYGRAIVGLQF